MERLLEKMYKTPAWKTILILFPSLSLLSFILFYLLNSISINITITRMIIISSAFGAGLTAAIVSLSKLIKIVEEFYDFAGEIEKMIMDGEDKELVLKKIFELQRKSFHRETGNKLREVARMFDAKYGTRILK